MRVMPLRLTWQPPGPIGKPDRQPCLEFGGTVAVEHLAVGHIALQERRFATVHVFDRIEARGGRQFDREAGGRHTWGPPQPARHGRTPRGRQERQRKTAIARAIRTERFRWSRKDRGPLHERPFLLVSSSIIARPP